MSKRKLFFDMDGVLVDFRSGIDKLSDETKREYEGRLDEVPGIFSLMDPMPGAIDAVKLLSEHYDVYILSTAPWKNPSAWSDKITWITKHFGELFKKRVILTHCKNLCYGDFLVDDRGKNGASEFAGEWIEFGSALYPGWEDVVDYLLAPEQRDGKTINRALVNDVLVEQTIATLDAYSKLLNDNYDGSREEYKKIMNLAALTNKWLKASGEEDESAYYID